MNASIKLSSPATREFWEVPVLYEDEYLLALDKPSGLATSPDRYNPDRPSLIKLLHTGIAEARPWSKERNLSYLMNAHRLDEETSGLILLAKSKPVLVDLVNLFGAEKPCKKYLALVHGAPPEALVPLMERTIANGFQLTGPIARGDWNTVDAHVRAIHEEAPELEPMYLALAEATKA